MQFAHFACGQRRFCGFNFWKWLLTCERCKNKSFTKITKHTVIVIFNSSYSMAVFALASYIHFCDQLSNTQWEDIIMSCVLKCLKNSCVKCALPTYIYAHCTVKIVSACWCVDSASAEMVGQGEVWGGGVWDRCVVSPTGCCALCQLLGLAVKRPWLLAGGPIFALVVQMGQLSPCRGFISGKEWFWMAVCWPKMLTSYYTFVNVWAWLGSWVCSSWL